MLSRRPVMLNNHVLCVVAAPQCVVGGCNASFASQGGLARHVPSHFSQQSSSKLSSQAKLKEESPSKAGLNKRKKLRNKRRCSLRTYPSDTLSRAQLKRDPPPLLMFPACFESLPCCCIDFVLLQLPAICVCGEAKGRTTHT